MSSLSITSSYTFIPIAGDALPSLREELLTFGRERTMQGLVLLAPEGINSTVCGTAEAIAEWKKRMRRLKNDIHFKDSSAEQAVFRRFSVKIKPELITFKQQISTPTGKHNHLTPQAWKQMMEREDVVLIDTRNDYETAIGTFRNAIVPGIQHFQDFPEAVRAAALPKDKTVMLYCTGGIRCEKAVLSMEEQGYTSVYQLEGGILAYIEQYPHDAFEGECFVFDRRVAVDQQLRPSVVFTFCTKCGDPTASAVCAGCSKQCTPIGINSGADGVLQALEEVQRMKA